MSNTTKPFILLTREQSSMVSTWTDHLCVSVDSGRFTIGIYMYEILGSIYELVPEDELYDEQGNMVFPAEINGQEVIGLADGEFVQIENLLESGPSLQFSSDQVEDAKAFADDHGWSSYSGFDVAMKQLDQYVQQHMSR